MTARQIDIKEFARRVERLCDFLINKVMEKDRTGSKNLEVIQDIKEDAADIQFIKESELSDSIQGLHDYMKGGETIVSSPGDDK